MIKDSSRRGFVEKSINFGRMVQKPELNGEKPKPGIIF